ncbi:MAG TPA: AMP-binding protein [Candidatus Acidoferrum sp.]|jgi:long-chain acyl-CoA synthetase
MPRENLLSLLDAFERCGGDIAVVQKRGYRRETWSYSRLAGMARGRAGFLKERGVGIGERVLLWAPNSAEWMAAFWGCALRGAVAVPMDDGASVDFVARVLRSAGVKFVFTTRERVLARGEVFDEGVEVVDLDGELWAIPAAPGMDVAAYADGPLTRASVAEILFTSGTTSEPRGVVLTHGNFLANLEPLEKGIEAYRKYERWFHPLRFVTLVPLSHVFGQFMALLVPPLLGATVVFEGSANPSEIMRTIRKARATALIAVPRMVEALRGGLEREIAARGDSEKFRKKFAAAAGQKFLRRAWMFRRVHSQLGWKFWAFISGGAALGQRDEEFFKRLGYAVVQGYGMTETASLISLNHPFRATEGTVGKILPGREFRLAEDGEILVRGENVSTGYWEGGELREAKEAGWLHTGDIGELDAAGNLRFRGRKKSVMVTAAGLNIYPEDLENALRKQPQVRDAVVVPVERDGNAEPCGVLLLNFPDNEQESKLPGAPKNLASAAISGANANLAEFQGMRTWVVWPEADFPRTATGKVRLGLVADRVREIRGGDESRVAHWEAGPTDESLEALIDKYKIRGVSGGAGLEADLNLSSLDRVELMSALEDKFRVELDETAFSKAKTVGEIHALLQKPAAQREEYSYPRWAQTTLMRFLRLGGYYTVVWPVTMLLAHPRVVGGENLQGLCGPALVVSNHITRRADIGLILAALPWRFRNQLATAMGGETLQRMRRPPTDWPVFRRWTYSLGYWLVTALFNVFPLPQRSGFRESFRFAGESVDRGYSVLVFPEGELSSNGKMASFQSGIGLLTQNLGLPAVPMRLDGVWQMKSEGRRWARSGEITVRIGAPLRFPAGADPESIARALHDAVQRL